MVLTVPDPRHSLQLSERNVFLVGLNEFNAQMLRRIRGAEHYRFHPLLDPEQIAERERWDVDALIDVARAQLDTFPGHIDAIAGYMDFPVSTMIPILCKELGLRSPSLEAILRCEHKYWSRLEQKVVCPEHVPEFRVFDPMEPKSVDAIDLPYPFWLKPVKSWGSHLGFRIRGASELEWALGEIRRKLPRIAEPFGRILERADLPDAVRSVPPYACLAEAIVGGRQCTLEGFRSDGELEIFGVVDSIRARNRTTFLRYEYPSELPRRVQRRMSSVARRLMAHLDFDPGAFNVEFFWDEKDDHIWLLEVNPRVSKSHSPLFEAVDGASNQQVTVHVALGEDPTFPYRQGPFAYAAKLFLRSFEDAVVRSAPTDDDVARLVERAPGTRVQMIARPGDRLSDQLGIDSYSYELAFVFVGANSRRELLERRRLAEASLRFDLERVS